MELSSLLEADIQGIQKQIKTAILNHQIGMMKLRNDPENLEIKKQIADAQNAIISLSTSQKFILQKLRNGMVTNGSSKACDNVPNSNGVIAVNGSTGCTHNGNNKPHNHLGQNINQHVSVVRPRPSAVSVGTETIGLAAVAKENQSTKTNGNYAPITPNVGCDASSLGGKHGQEGLPCTRPHQTPQQIKPHQNSDWPVDVPPRSQINLVPRVNSSLNRASLSPSSSGGEDLDDDDDDEEEEENAKGFDFDEEDDMEELKYIPEEDEKEECHPKKENQPPFKVDPQIHPSDDNDVDSKLKFFAALGLVTRETCSEMQSRRGERKRRSTANPQFVYGNWDLSVKRKKNGYLLSSSIPLQLRKRGRPRLDGSSELLLPASYLPLPKSVSNVPYSKDGSNICGNDHFNENQHQFGLNRNHQMLGHALGGALKPSQHYYAADSNHSFSTGHHTKKPLEHINGNITTIRKFCIVCKNISGPLVLCEDCDVRYHPFCGKPLDGKRHCPKCDTHSSSSGAAPTSNAKKEEVSTVTVSCKDTAVTTSLPSSTVTCSAQVTTATPALHSVAAERAAKVEEKRRLLKRNQELNAEKAKLEQRVSDLSADLAAQAARKRDLLSAEERTRRSIKRVHEFILNIQQGFKRVDEEGCLFKTATSSGPCSVATDTSEGIQAS